MSDARHKIQCVSLQHDHLRARQGAQGGFRTRRGLFQQMQIQSVSSPVVHSRIGVVIAACTRVGDAVIAEQLFGNGKPAQLKSRIPPYNTMQLSTHTEPDREKVLFYLNKMAEVNVHLSAYTYKVGCPSLPSFRSLKFVAAPH